MTEKQAFALWNRKKFMVIDWLIQLTSQYAHNADSFLLFQFFFADDEKMFLFIFELISVSISIISSGFVMARFGW